MVQLGRPGCKLMSSGEIVIYSDNIYYAVMSPSSPAPELARVLESAADHDHVLNDLSQRFDAVLEALEADPAFVLNRAAHGKIILGELGGIETGVRQLIRTVPLETERITLPSGHTLVVPTIAEALRIKAYLALKRNQTRDYLDIAALAANMGEGNAARVLRDIDRFYADVARGDDAVSSQVARQLAAPEPRDSGVTRQLHHYKGIRPPWDSWPKVCAALTGLAAAMVEGE
jgi:hypothetical protein